MFPEIRSLLGKVFNRDSGAPITLNLKAANSTELSLATDWYLRNGYQNIYRALGGGTQTWSGERVSVESALNHSVVWACNRIISETIGFIPIVMKQEDKNGDLEDARKHPMYDGLLHEPNVNMTAMGLKETINSHAVLRGNGYGKIERRSGTGVALEIYPIHPDRVMPDFDTSGRLVYVVKDDKTYTVKRGVPQDIFHLRGIGDNGTVGYSVLHMARQSIGTAIAAERNVANFYRRGGRLAYNLKLVRHFKTEDDGKKFRNDWEEISDEPNRAHIIPPDIDYQSVGINLKDAQLLETRLFGIHEICRWFGVSPHLVGDLSKATFSNIEQLALEFVKLTLSAWITRWEEELRRCILTPDEKKQGYKWQFDLNSLLRGDFATRMAGYATMLQNGPYSVNDVLKFEGMNKLKNGMGDGHNIQLNMQPLQNVGLTPDDGDDNTVSI